MIGSSYACRQGRTPSRQPISLVEIMDEPQVPGIIQAGGLRRIRDPHPQPCHRSKPDFHPGGLGATGTALTLPPPLGGVFPGLPRSVRMLSTCPSGPRLPIYSSPRSLVCKKPKTCGRNKSASGGAPGASRSWRWVPTPYAHPGIWPLLAFCPRSRKSPGSQAGDFAHF